MQMRLYGFLGQMSTFFQSNVITLGGEASRHTRGVGYHDYYINDESDSLDNVSISVPKYHDYYINDELGEELEAHHNNMFVNFIVSEIERFREATKEINL